MRGYYHVCYVLFVCGFTSYSIIFNTYGDNIEGIVNIIELRLVLLHVGIFEIEKGAHDNFIILGLKTG